MKINPPNKKFVIFSGGGGLMVRSQTVEVPAGRTIFEIDDVPASFDPNTTTIEISEPSEGSGIELVQIDVRRPDKRIIDSFIAREKNASNAIIQSSTDLRGESRDRIIQICESAYYRRFEDMFGAINVVIDAKAPGRFTLQVKYFLEDSRIKWRPGIHAYIDPKSKTSRVEFHIQVMNNSDFSFENVEVQFAEFELESEVGEQGYLANIATEQAVQNKMSAPNLLRQVKRVKKFFK